MHILLFVFQYINDTEGCVCMSLRHICFSHYHQKPIHKLRIQKKKSFNLPSSFFFFFLQSIHSASFPNENKVD